MITKLGKDKIYGESPVATLMKVKDRKKLPPMVEIKILTEEEKRLLKKEATELAKELVQSKLKQKGGK